jgi:CO/xanthine dehydrogenase Mo-binding subunit
VNENEFKVVGKRHPKIEAVYKATGQLKFTGDLHHPGCLHARVLRSPLAHAEIKHINISKAAELRGVKAVITHKDVPAIPTMHQFLHVPSVMFFDSYLLEKKVRHYGDRVAAVAATHPDIAEEALDLIEVDYEPLPVMLDPLEAIKKDSPAIHSQAKFGDDITPIRNNTLAQREFEIGDVEKGFNQADLVVKNLYRTSRPNNAPLERTTALCIPGLGGTLEIYATTQGIHAMRMNIASSLGIPLSKLNCHRVYLGGSFGAHIHTGWLEPICAFLALKTGLPVRGEKSRKEMFMTCGRHPMILNLKTGVKKDGTLIAQTLDVIDETGAYAFSGGSKMVLASGWFLSMYKCPNMKFSGKTVYTNTAPLTAMRGAANPQVHFAVESQMDIIAEKLNMDPVELRLKNHIASGDTFYGQGPDVVADVLSCGTEDLMRQASKKIGWNKRRELTAEKPWIKRGIGMARGFHTSGAGSAKPSKFIMDYSGAIVKMNEDGTAVLLNAAADAGGGNNSAHAAMVAEELGLNYEDVIVELGDTNTTLFDVPTHASRANYGAGLAVVQAARQVKQKLFDWAADILEAAKEDLVAEGGKIFVSGSKQRYVTIREVVQKAQYLGWGSASGQASIRPEACPPHFIVCFVEVAVDTTTGKVELLRAVSGADVGTPINLNTIEGQMVGGLHMGLGYGLMEDTLFEAETGKILNADFIDYKILTMLDMPQTETIIADTFEPTGPFGAKGVGEGVTNPVAAAVANAIYAAVGVRVLELPISAEKILAGIQAADNAGNKGSKERTRL